MSITREWLPIINALPDAVVIVSREKGVIIGGNDIFFKSSGFTVNDLVSTRLFNLPFFKKRVMRGLLRLFVQVAKSGGRGSTFSFPYVDSKQTVRNIEATAGPFTVSGQKYILFTFRELPSQEILITGDEAESWQAYLNLAYEPYMEFRPPMPLRPFSEQDDRTVYLRDVGMSLEVKFANNAAVRMYKGEGGGSLAGQNFFSFFSKREDALRFLDMLSIVGQMKAQTTVNIYDRLVQVEMNCVVRFDDKGTIAAVYCGQRDMSGYRHYESIIGGSRLEMEFTFNQPFTGFAFLEPLHPLERPQADTVDIQLDGNLRRIMIVRANQAIMDIYGSDKTKFLMKTMTELFPNDVMARQVLKELFVMRVTSAAVYAVSQNEKGTPEEKLKHVSIFRAAFDDMDRLTGIFVATSKDESSYKARHSNKTGP